MAESIPRGDSSISSLGDPSAGVSMDCCRKFSLVGSDEPGEVMYDGSEPTTGKVWRRGRELALASVGRRVCWADMRGLGLELETGEKYGDVGLRKSPEKAVLSV